MKTTEPTNVVNAPLLYNSPSRLAWFAWCGGCLIMENTEEAVLTACNTLVRLGACEGLMMEPQVLIY